MKLPAINAEELLTKKEKYRILRISLAIRTLFCEVPGSIACRTRSKAAYASPKAERGTALSRRIVTTPI
jgi:hypothetical protein